MRRIWKGRPRPHAEDGQRKRQRSFSWNRVWMLLLVLIQGGRRRGGQSDSASGSGNFLVAAQEDNDTLPLLGLEPPEEYEPPDDMDDVNRWCPDCRLTWPASRIWRGMEFSDDDEDLCDPCAQPWLFVLGTGRSGSTTLLNMLNELGVVQLAGEIAATMVEDAAHMLEAAREARFEGRFSGGARQHGKLSEAQLVCDLQSWFIDMNPAHAGRHRNRFVHETAVLSGPPEVRGFKDIKLISDTHRGALEALFPCHKVVFSLREDLMSQVRSGFWKWAKGDPQQRLSDRTQEFLHWHAARGGHRTAVMPLESFSVDRFEALREWLGVDGCRYRRVRRDHANGTYLPETSLEPVVEGICFLPP